MIAMHFHRAFHCCHRHRHRRHRRLLRCLFSRPHEEDGQNEHIILKLQSISWLPTLRRGSSFPRWASTAAGGALGWLPSASAEAGAVLTPAASAHLAPGSPRHHLPAQLVGCRSPPASTAPDSRACGARLPSSPVRGCAPLSRGGRRPSRRHRPAAKHGVGACCARWPAGTSAHRRAHPRQVAPSCQRSTRPRCSLKRRQQPARLCFALPYAPTPLQASCMPT